jgi:DNA invertase Pin-like site-specific DNA recombinase
MKRTAIYARISTQEGTQHLENQVARCRDFILHTQEWRPPQAAYTDEITGAAAHRPGLERMLQDALARKFDVLVVFDLSRLTREGPARAFELIDRLKRAGCDFVSVNEPHFRSTGIAGDLLIAIAAYVAREERRILRARVQAGIEAARRRGKILGRPTKEIDPGHLLRLRREGRSLREIAVELQCSKTTVERRIKRDPHFFRPSPDVSD